MSSLNIYAQESKKNEAESVSAREFWDKFIKDPATDLLASYEMNDTQGVPGSGEGWEGNDVEDIPNTYADGTTREDFNAELRREFIGNLGYFESTGYHDGELGYLIDKAYDAASDSYCMDNNLASVPEDGTTFEIQIGRLDIKVTKIKDHRIEASTVTLLEEPGQEDEDPDDKDDD